MAYTQLACEKSIKCRKLTKQPKNEVKLSKIDQFFCAEEGQEWTVSTTTATVQYIMTKILQKYSTFSFYNTVYSAHNENEIEYSDIDMCDGEPLVWMTPYFYCKKLSSDKKQPFIRAGVAIPAGALLSGFHCDTCRHVRMIPQVVPEQAFCELQRTALTEFFTAYQIIFCLFWHLANSAYPQSCGLLFPTDVTTQR